jgi:hypothetical protein
MRNLFTITVCTIIATAGIAAVDAIAQSTQQKPADNQQAEQQPTPPTAPQAGRRKFRMKLTLSEPGDLRIREGDKINAGQIIADRLKERTRLEAQRMQVELSLKLDVQVFRRLPDNRD